MVLGLWLQGPIGNFVSFLQRGFESLLRKRKVRQNTPRSVHTSYRTKMRAIARWRVGVKSAELPLLSPQACSRRTQELSASPSPRSPNLFVAKPTTHNVSLLLIFMPAAQRLLYRSRNKSSVRVPINQGTRVPNIGIVSTADWL
jgi:hypothetical protein